MGTVLGHELGVPGTPLRGRDDDVAAVLAALAEPAVRLVTITGRGGVGKTALARAVAGALADDVRIVVLPLAGVASHAFVLGTILSELGAAPGGAPADGVIAALGDTPTVLVLDNFEHVLPAAPALADLLARVPSLQLLVTSQAPLRLRSERVVALGPLPVPAPGLDAPVDIGEVPSVQLYCDRAASVDRSFRFDAANAPAVAELCRRLEGLPLAIELAAARAATLPATDILERLHVTPLDLLRRPRADAPGRHHSMRDAIAWSVELLDDRQRTLLRRLSVVNGPFDLDVVDALGGDPGGEDIAALVDVHLVDPHPGPDGRATFALPAGIRAVASELLLASGERDDTRTAHRRAAVAWAQRAARGMSTADEASWLDRVGARYDDLVACLLDSVGAGEVEHALELANGLEPWWSATGYHAEHDELLRGVLDLAAGRGVRDAAHAVALASWAYLPLQQQLVESTGDRFEALAAAEAMVGGTEDVDARLRVLAARVLVAPFDPDPSAAPAAAAEGRALATASGGPRWQAAFEVWHGMLLHRGGAEELAVELLLRGLALAREIGDDRTVAVASLGLNPLLARFPEVAAVVPPAREVLEIARRSRHTMIADVALPHAVVEALAAGDVEAAGELVVHGLVVARTAPKTLAGFLLLAAAMWLAAAGEDEQAAWLHAVLEPAMPLLDATSAAEHAESRRRRFDQVIAALPDGGRAARRRAAGLSWSAAAQQAEDVVRRRLAVHTTTRERAAGVTAGPRLTPRQTEVLGLAAAGLSNSEIGAQLGLTVKTVMHHLHAIYLAIGVRGRTQAAAWAFRNGMAS